MELNQKIINFLGDSITFGAGAADHGNRFVNRIAHLTGAICNNYGIPGTRIAPQHQPSSEPRRDSDFCSRLDEMDPNADVVVVFGGTNDYGHGDAPFGEDTDKTADTFCGALRILCQRLRERFPNALIVMLTPMHRCAEDNVFGEGAKREPSLPLIAYVEQIRKAAAEYCFPVLDLYEERDLDPNDDFVCKSRFRDGLHPNDAGHIIIADKIIEFLTNQVFIPNNSNNSKENNM